MSRWARQRLALDGQTEEERRIARLSLKLDYPGQKRESNGQFGTGKKVGGSSGGGSGSSGNKSTSQPTAKPRSNYASTSGKAKKRVDEVSNAISSGKAKIRESGMKAHMPNTKEFREHAARSAASGHKQGVFTGGYEQYVPGVIQALKDRNATFKVLKGGQISAKIDFGTEVGTAFGRNDDKGHPVHAVEVRFSKENNDWHFFPCDMEDD